MKKEYALIDSGNGYKLEQFGPYLVKRPAAQALWSPALPAKVWDAADLLFSREGGNEWTYTRKVESVWSCTLEGITCKISPTDFGHLGIFPEHSTLWKEMENLIVGAKRPVRLLNLFAYSGGATLAAAKAGASVCHLDASKGMVSWAKENALLNSLDTAPIRWIVDDVFKFLERESRRSSFYDGIILDPPSYGRGSNKEIFKIEKDIKKLLTLCKNVLVENPLFVFFTSHTQGMSPLVMHHLLEQMMEKNTGIITAGEMIIPSKEGYSLPCGSYGIWSYLTENG